MDSYREQALSETENLAEKMATTVSDLRAKGQVREKIKQGNTQTPSEKGTCSYGNIEERAENNAEVIIK